MLKQTLATVPLLSANEVLPLLRNLPEPTTPSGRALASILSDLDPGGAILLASVAQGFTARLPGVPRDVIRKAGWFRWVVSAYPRFQAFDDAVRKVRPSSWRKFVREFGLPTA